MNIKHSLEIALGTYFFFSLFFYIIKPNLIGHSWAAGAENKISILPPKQPSLLPIGKSITYAGNPQKENPRGQ